MKLKITHIVFLIILTLTNGCQSKDSANELVEFVQNNSFGGPVPIFMERRGDFFSDRWYKVTLYFGYGDNWNWVTCTEDAERLNLEGKKDSFRCVLAK